MLYLSDLQISPMIENLGGRSPSRVPPSRRKKKNMQRTIKRIFQDVPVLKTRGDTSFELSALITDSRRVVPGAAFFARDGRRTDGNFYVEEAIDRGASLIVSSRPPGLHRGVAWIQTEDVLAALAEASRVFYGKPDEGLQVVGVTGTNGKTTVTTLVQYLMGGGKEPCGLLGTIRYDLGGRTIPSYKTTPESVDTFAMLAQMKAAGCGKVAMEISSHGIEQKRVEGLRVEVAAFLNLTQDHLDYHGDMETYFGIKARLFTGQTGSLPSKAVVSLDDPYGRRLLKMLPGDLEVLTFGEHPEARVRALDLKLSPEGLRFTALTPKGSFPVQSSLLGRYNASNILAALAIGIACGEDPAHLTGRIAGFGGVPGRMERVNEGQPFHVLVDYAHTDDALRNALTMLREVSHGRLLVVFGCGGDRDRAKRPLMMRQASGLADVVWATADNPRSEGMARIFDDMAKGMAASSDVRFIEDRRSAIHAALEEAREDDVVLIAGKGHETFQEFADTAVPFDDRLVARDLLKIKAALG